MKTDKNSRINHPVRDSAHPEQAVPDSNQSKARKYRIHFIWTQTCEAFVTIKAASLAEAEALADEIESEDIPDGDLKPIDGELIVDDVTPLEEGQGHD